MKDYLIVCGFLGILFVCNAAEDGKNVGPAVFSNSPTEQELKNHYSDNSLQNLEKSIDRIDPKVENELLSERNVQNDTLIIMSIVPDMMKFSEDTITVKAGQKVVLELENTDGMQHNMLIIMPGTLKKVGAAADALARDPEGAQKQYVPDTPDVLYSTKLLDPEEIATLTFTAPKEPGSYPFVCTFPGHWRMMNGIMIVSE